MEMSINPTRVRKALEAAEEVVRQLKAALSEAERPRPNPPPGPARSEPSQEYAARGWVKPYW
jgi:hypothetical protein